MLEPRIIVCGINPPKAARKLVSQFRRAYKKAFWDEIKKGKKEQKGGNDV